MPDRLEKWYLPLTEKKNGFPEKYLPLLKKKFKAADLQSLKDLAELIVLVLHIYHETSPVKDEFLINSQVQSFFQNALLKLGRIEQRDPSLFKLGLDYSINEGLVEYHVNGNHIRLVDENSDLIAGFISEMNKIKTDVEKKSQPEVQPKHTDSEISYPSKPENFITSLHEKLWNAVLNQNGDWFQNSTLGTISHQGSPIDSNRISKWLKAMVNQNDLVSRGEGNRSKEYRVAQKYHKKV